MTKGEEKTEKEIVKTNKNRYVSNARVVISFVYPCLKTQIIVEVKSYVERRACFCVFVYLSVLISALFCYRSQKFQGLLRGALKDKLVADTLVTLSKQLTPVKSLIGLYFLY